MFKLKDVEKEEGIWFDFPGEEGVRFQIRRVPAGKALELKTQASRRVAVPLPNPAPGFPAFMVDNTPDDAEWSQLIFDFILQNFEGIELDSAPPLPPEELRKAIRKAIYNHDPFRKFITDRSNELSESQKESSEREAKNGSGSRAG